MAEAAVTEESGDVITQCTCKIKKKDYTVAVTNSNLRWHLAGNKGQKDLHVVRIEDILSAKLQTSSKQASDSDSVKICYVKQEKKLILKMCSVVFTSADLQLVKKLHQQVTDLIALVQQRPKRLLVLINPVSGRSKGRTMYEQKVAPIFKEAGIKTEVIVTERAHHTQEILLTYDITTIDGLVVVGGDGLYHEAVNGLMEKLTKEQGVNADDPNASLPEIPIRIGLIPCGTGNGISLSCYGNYDVVTAGLSIAIGYQMEGNVMSVHSGGKLIAYSILLVGYGMWGDIIHTAETRRDQGVLRYITAIFEHAFIKPIRMINLTIQSVTDGRSGSKTSAETNEAAKANEATGDEGNIEGIEKTDNLDHASLTNPETKTSDVNVLASIIFMSEVVQVQNQVKPDLSHSSMYLNTSPLRRKFISFMFDMMSQNFERFERREDILTIPGKEWNVKLNDQSEAGTEVYTLNRTMNIDGEIIRLQEPAYQARVLPKKIRLFTNLPFATRREKKK